MSATMSTERVSSGRFALALFALAMGGFAIGTTEFVTMGVLPEIAADVGVSVPTAGHLISAYAVGVVVGVPLLSIFGTGLPHRGMLIGLMVVYAFFNLVTVLATNYHVLVAARFLDGLPHGAYFGIASLVAARMAPPDRKGRAVATVMLGLSVANLAGVPAATWMGQQFGWRAPYLASVGLALLTAALVLAFVPMTPRDRQASGRREAKMFFGNLQVWLTMIAGAAGFGGLFAVYSYIAEIVKQVAGLGAGAVPIFTLAFGLGMVVGTWLGGELARWSVYRSLLAGGAATFVVMLLFWAVAPFGWWLWPVTFLVTATGSVLVVNLQLRLMDVAGDAVTLGAAMNHAALNIANALGAWLGGLVIAAGFGYRAPALVGAALAVVGTAVLIASALVHRRS